LVAPITAPTMIPSELKDFWDEIYRSKAETGVSWYQEEPRLSLELISAIAPVEGGRIVDIGGGASVLVDRLFELHFTKIAVLDISKAALGKARSRLGERSGRVEWLAADVTSVRDIGIFDVWHDRAVFHFLTEAADRQRYVELARRTVPEGGHLVVATFANDGPKMCSGLDVNRYDADSLRKELGPGFSLVREAREAHTTPWSSSQPFFYGVFKRLVA
jgi:SAM-dependent methyltransferase